jgi:hypothetical protein
MFLRARKVSDAITDYTINSEAWRLFKTGVTGGRNETSLERQVTLMESFFPNPVISQ